MKLRHHEERRGSVVEGGGGGRWEIERAPAEGVRAPQQREKAGRKIESAARRWWKAEEEGGGSNAMKLSHHEAALP